MKKAMPTMILILGMSVGLSAPQVIAAPEAGQPASQTSTEKSWQDALKTQVSIAKANVSLLQAHSELWVEKNRESALQSLDKARASLDEGWHSADQMTRARITALKLDIDQAKKLLKEKGQGAEAELKAISNRSESALNAALTQAQSKSSVLKDEAASRYALVQAKAAMLKARIALEIDQSPDKAGQALKEAENALQQAKETASKATAAQIAKLQKQAQAARQNMSGEVDKTKTQVRTLIIATEARIQSYEKRLKDSEEAKLLKKRYAQLEAHAALLKANLATKADVTGEQATAYLNESKAWYESVKAEASNRGEKELVEMSQRIEEAKQAVARKDEQVRAKLSALLDQAAKMAKD